MLKFDKNEVFLLPADETGRSNMKDHIEAKRGFLNVNILAKSILSYRIDAYSVGSGGRCIVVAAAHHALESITSNLAFLLIDALLGLSEFSSVYGVDCKLLLSKYRFIILPCVNPDGIELRFHGADNSPLKDREIKMSGGDFSHWQANARGVDLNHNYDFRFEEYKLLERERGIEAGNSLYSGEYPESEPETRAVANLIRVINPCAVVSLHSQGEEIYGYPGSEKTERCLGRLMKITGYEAASPSGTAAYGGLCDYTGSLGIPSFTYEVGKGKNPLPESDVFSIFERIAESIVILPTLL